MRTSYHFSAKVTATLVEKWGVFLTCSLASFQLTKARERFRKHFSTYYNEKCKWTGLEKRKLKERPKMQIFGFCARTFFWWLTVAICGESVTDVHAKAVVWWHPAFGVGEFRATSVHPGLPWWWSVLTSAHKKKTFLFHRLTVTEMQGKCPAVVSSARSL